MAALDPRFFDLALALIALEGAALLAWRRMKGEGPEPRALVANLAALTQPRPQRRYPRVLAAAGAVLYVVLAVTLGLMTIRNHHGWMFVFGFIVLSLQPLAPLNPDDKHMLAPTTIFNTACSFLTNTNLQHYSGEQHLSYFSQMSAILWNMFVSASVGFCGLTAIIRGLRGDSHMGNFYVDMWRMPT